ncbi:hypothetical protein [Microbacterium yannicii]|uniref:hypothetical protein n=1 Tax=Microbacterium yannicii TaxID=671622 RepID=UPI0002F56EE7|nr:hypothetical protein [Microbacterium yannicii]
MRSLLSYPTPTHASDLPGIDPAGNPSHAPIGGLLIESRLNGPRRSANGGFAAGTFARHVDADVVTVVLRRPVPVNRTLAVEHDGRGGCVISRRGRTVALARPGHLADAEAPASPSFDEALEARSRHPLTGVRHALSDCVVCGPARADGMRVTPGFVPERPELLVAPWQVGSAESTAGIAHLRAVWAAMDCTSFPASALRERRLCLLGTMTAKVERRPRVGERLVVYSWTRGEYGRRYETSVALVDRAGDTVARADATWVALEHQRLHALLMR